MKVAFVPTESAQLCFSKSGSGRYAAAWRHFASTKLVQCWLVVNRPPAKFGLWDGRKKILANIGPNPLIFDHETNYSKETLDKLRSRQSWGSLTSPSISVHECFCILPLSRYDHSGWESKRRNFKSPHMTKRASYYINVDTDGSSD